ncbi:small nuclear ribonucleoprotein SmF, partial [Penicillium sp. IBT 18751x]
SHFRDAQPQPQDLQAHASITIRPEEAPPPSSLQKSHSPSSWKQTRHHPAAPIHHNEPIPQFQPLNPRPFLQARVGTELVIRLKWGQTEYKGTLESIDSYMNVLLRDTEEYLDGKHTGSLGLVLIRCNNILWMGDASTVEMKDVGLQ